MPDGGAIALGELQPAMSMTLKSWHIERTAMFVRRSAEQKAKIAILTDCSNPPY